MDWRGCELHYVGGTSDKFYRIVRSGRVVVIRHGRRGAEGRLIVRRYDDTWDAREAAEGLLREKERSHGYDQVYNDPDGPGAPLPQDPDEIEMVFLARWRAKLDGMLGTGPKWVVVSGLASVGAKNPGTECLLNQATRGLHARNDHRDLIVTRRARECSQSVDASGPAKVGVWAVIGDYDKNDNEAVLNAALSLYSDEHPEPGSIMAVARLLATEFVSA